MFEPEKHVIKLPRWTKDEYGNSVKVEDDYLEVKWRLVWFRDRFPNGTIETQEVCVDLDKEITVERTRWVKGKKEFYTATGKGYARYKAVVTTGEGGVGTGTKTESAVDFPDFCEKAETGAIGRALAALGFGTQFTGDELEDAHRIVDTPVKRDDAHKPEPLPKLPTPLANEKEENSHATEQQVSSIRKLCEHLRKPEPENITSLTFLDARKVIQQLTHEYKLLREEKQPPPQVITVASIRRRVGEIKPSITNDQKQLVIADFEQFYYAVTGKTFQSDDAVTPEECKKMSVCLDVVERNRINRANKNKPAAS